MGAFSSKAITSRWCSTSPNNFLRKLFYCIDYCSIFISPFHIFFFLLFYIYIFSRWYKKDQLLLTLWRICLRSELSSASSCELERTRRGTCPPRGPHSCARTVSLVIIPQPSCPTFGTTWICNGAKKRENDKLKLEMRKWEMSESGRNVWRLIARHGSNSLSCVNAYDCVTWWLNFGTLSCFR